MKVDRSKFLLLCACAVPLAAIACGGAGDDGTAAGGAALSDTPAASGSSKASAPAAAPDAVTVQTKASTYKTDQCTKDLKLPTVSIPTNKAAETAINRLFEDMPALIPCGDGDGATASAAFEVTVNSAGLLSIRITGQSSSVGGAQPDGFVVGYNFDVKNGGNELILEDVLSAAGMAKELAQCAKTLDGFISADGGVPDDAGVGAPTDESSEGWQNCKTSLTANPQRALEPVWVATKDGLEIESQVPAGLGDYLSSTVSWKDLGTDDLNPNTPVATFAEAAR